MIGEGLLNLIQGGEDPRIALMRGLAGQAMPPQVGALQAGAPPAGDGTPAPAPGGPGTGAAGGAAGAPQAPPQPRAYSSPNDLISLYSAVAERERRANAIDRGLTMIAAAGARPDQRNTLLGMASSGGGGGGGSGSGGGSGLANNPLGFIQGITQLQQNRITQQQTAARRAALPQLAQRYNMPLEAITQLFDTGKLEEFVSNAEKPNRQIQTLANGQIGIMELGGQNPRLIGTYGMETPRTYRAQTLADGRIAPYDERSGTLGTPQGPTTPTTPTSGQIELDRANAERRAAGQPPLTMEQWNAIPAPNSNQAELNRANAERAAAGQPPLTMEQWNALNPRGTRVEVNAATKKEDEEFAKILAENYRKSEAATSTISSVQNAQQLIQRGIIAGSSLSPHELEGRRILGSIFGASDEQVQNTDQFLAHMRGVVRSSIKDLGSGNGITDNDLRFTEQAVGATNALSPQSLQQILLVQEFAARKRIMEYNQTAERRRAGNPNSSVELVQMPDPSEFAVQRVPGGAVTRLRELSTGSPEEQRAVRNEFNAKFGPGMAEYFLRQGQR